MIEIGRVCVKLAGREAGKKCVIVDVIDNNYVLIDGDVRRKKCNIKHIEPLDKVIKISKGADHSTIVDEFKKLGVEIKERKSKERKAKPKKQRKVREKKVKERPKKKKEKAKKEEVKENIEEPNKK